MAIADLDKFKWRVLRLLGQPDIEEMDDEWLSDLIEDAILEYSRYFPAASSYALTLVDGQTRYALPANAIGVDTTIEYGSSVSTVPNLTGYESDYSPSRCNTSSLLLTTMDERYKQHELEFAQLTYPGRQVTFEDGELVVVPTPSSNETIYIPLYSVQTLSQFPSAHEEMLKYLCAAKGCEELANFRSKFEKVKVGSHITQLRYPQWLRDEATKFRNMFKDLASGGGVGGSALLG